MTQIDFNKLREPLSKEDIELRIGTVTKNGCTLLLYKTARVDARRLDEVCGQYWQRKHYVDIKGSVVCAISIYNHETNEWISREDVGSESNTEKEKGSYSDSFKRAGSAWGIGRELYSAPFIFVDTAVISEDGKSKLSNKFFDKDLEVTKYEVKDGVIIALEIQNTKTKDVVFPKQFTNNSTANPEASQATPNQDSVRFLVKTENAEIQEKLRADFFKQGSTPSRFFKSCKPEWASKTEKILTSLGLEKNNDGVYTIKGY